MAHGSTMGHIVTRVTGQGWDPLRDSTRLAWDIHVAFQGWDTRMMVQGWHTRVAAQGCHTHDVTGLSRM